MRHVRLARAALVALSMLGAVPAARAKHIAFGRCQIGTSRVLSAAARVVVYRSHGGIQGCDVRSGRHRELANVGGCSPDSCAVAATATAGRVAVVAAEFRGRSGMLNELFGYDFGRRRWTLFRENGELSAEDLARCGYGDSGGAGHTMRLVVAPSGAAAWIARQDCRDPSLPISYEVHVTDGSTSPVVASGADIDPSSLALAGGRVFWLQSGIAASTTLGSPPADTFEPLLPIGPSKAGS